MNFRNTYLFFIAFLIMVVSCDDVQEQRRFQKIEPEFSGVHFANNLKETPLTNIFNYMYFYNGGGVAVGDINGDDLPDIYFTSNQENNVLYLNKGDFKFEDITEKAGVQGEKGWATGVCMADVNGDGLLDIYVSQVGDHLDLKGKNQLYINKGVNRDGIPFFENEAEAYGLDVSVYGTQASFFDYDLDGDLDVFLLNHSVHNNGTFGRKYKFEGRYHPTAGDRLFRNDGGQFIDVTTDSGIYSNALGYGLGIAHSDFNQDGYPDIYIANDFHEDDYLYINNGDGTFTDVQKESFRHTSRFSMGVDIGDINNDGLMEVMTLDMLPEDPVILKASAAEDAFDVYQFKVNFGYSHQFARNNLQLNMGKNPQNNLPYYSEIALYSGIAATDWSWSALFADFDHDEFNDLFISNGILRRSNDLDYINYISHDTIQYRLKEIEIQEKDMALISKMPKIKLPNYLYQNDGSLGFNNVAEEWGLSDLTYSHGTAYADFDLDGDLDLVINNTEDKAGVYRNMLIENSLGSTNYLIVKLKAKGLNKLGIGSTVQIMYSDKKQVKELYTTKGFQSSVEPMLHFGLKDVKQLDTLIVDWPNGDRSILTDIAVNQKLVLSQEELIVNPSEHEYSKTKDVYLMDRTEEINLPFIHTENRFVEFNREALLPHMLSQEGPAMVIEDFNGDGLDDIFVGNSKRELAHIYFQTTSGSFYEQEANQELFDQDKMHEEVSAIAFDADQDGDLDLAIGSGGNEYSDQDDPMIQRLLINDGQGNFVRDTTFPNIYQTNGSVIDIDFDQDGDLDLIFGGRAVPWKYGEVPDSYLIENKGNGKFEDVTTEKAAFLTGLGFVQDMVKMDIDGDNNEEIAIALEWDVIKFGKCNDGKISLLEDHLTGMQMKKGWWNTIVPMDIDQDGDNDFIAGNLGLNSKLEATQETPIKMYYLDYDDNGKAEQILCHYYQGQYRVFATKEEVVSQLPELKKKFNTYTGFAEAGLHDIFSKKALNNAAMFEAHELANCYFINDGTGSFTMKRMDQATQFSTIEKGISTDITGDGANELVLAGNFYPVNIQMGRYDANYGIVLSPEKDELRIMNQEISGLNIQGVCRGVQLFQHAIHGNMIVFAMNNEVPRFYEISNSPEIGQNTDIQ